MDNRMQDLHVEHVQALDDEGLATLIKAMAFDIPRMQALLAIARREVRRRKRAARGPSATPTPPGGRNNRAAIAAAGKRNVRGGVAAVRETGRGSSLGASDAGNADRNKWVVSAAGSY